MSRREMERLTTEQLKTMKTDTEVTSHEVFLIDMILDNRKKQKKDDDFWFWFTPEDVNIFDHLQYPKRGDYPCRIDD